MTLTKDSVEAFITNYVDEWSECAKRNTMELWEKFVNKYYTKDYIMIRPSGNPMTSEMLLEMVSSGDAKNMSVDLVSIDAVKIVADGKVATTYYKCNEYFTFKGKANEDRVVYSAVIEEMPDGSMKMAHGHRTTGVPIPI